MPIRLMMKSSVRNQTTETLPFHILMAARVEIAMVTEGAFGLWSISLGGWCIFSEPKSLLLYSSFLVNVLCVASVDETAM
mmetsp:Transcript_31754/g.64489  ORF Transcript_31754/g.64489 Transcript_31754/m.64489 type:complete len:80 (-) Transcript_31754:164-403(-)